MEIYKSYYIEERWEAPGLMPQEVVMYTSEYNMTRGIYDRIFSSFEEAKAWIDQQELPKVEFEGPLGIFYSPDDVSIEALVVGAVEIVNAMARKGTDPLTIVRMIREKGGQI